MKIFLEKIRVLKWYAMRGALNDEMFRGAFSDLFCETKIAVWDSSHFNNSSRMICIISRPSSALKFYNMLARISAHSQIWAFFLLFSDGKWSKEFKIRFRTASEHIFTENKQISRFSRYFLKSNMRLKLWENFAEFASIFTCFNY